MKSLVVYKSISGFTKRYAEWIAEEIEAECIDIGKMHDTDITEFDLVIFGGSLHAVGLNGYKEFKEYIPVIGSSKIIIFAVGASPSKPDIEKEIKNANMHTEEESKIPLFYLRGGFNFSKLDTKNKILMKLFQWKLLSKKNKTSDENGMLAAYKTPLDEAKKDNIHKMIEYIRTTYNKK